MVRLRHVSMLFIYHLTLCCKAHRRLPKPLLRKPSLIYQPVGATEVGLFYQKTWIQTHSLRLQHTRTHTHTAGQVAKQSSVKHTKRLLLTWACPQKPEAGKWYHCHRTLCKLYTEIYSSKRFDSSGMQHVIEPFHSLNEELTEWPHYTSLLYCCQRDLR